MHLGISPLITVLDLRCVAVETIKTDDDNNNASAELSLIEIIVGQTPDYETFDTLYVYLQVTDLNTEMNAGTDSGKNRNIIPLTN